MAVSPEQEKDQKPLVDTIPEQISEVAPEIEKTQGVSQVPSQFSKKAADDMAGSGVQTPQTSSVSIQLPAVPSQLDDWAKGDPENAITWLAMFWIRLIKKALHFGWKILNSVKGDK